MPPAAPGHFWKTPFVCLAEHWHPPPSKRLRYQEPDDLWLRKALPQTLATSLSESDQHLVARLGPDLVADDLLARAAEHFIRPPHWWRVGLDAEGQAVGFVLPVLFKEPELDPQGQQRPEGTIFHMGVLPPYRGHGYALELINEATRLCMSVGCWRVFCDTASANAPMIKAFREAGYEELPPWQRPLS